MDHTIINILSETHLERHNLNYCDEELSKVQRVQQFVKDQILFMNKKTEHYESLIEQDYENTFVLIQNDINSQQQTNKNKIMMIEDNRLVFKENNNYKKHLKYSIPNANTLSLTHENAPQSLCLKRRNKKKRPRRTKVSLILSTVQNQRHQRKKKQRQRKKDPLTRTTKPTSFHLLEKFTSPNIQISRISMGRGTNNSSNRRAGMFNNGKSSSKARKRPQKRGAPDLVFSETKFLAPSSNTTNDKNNDASFTSVSAPSLFQQQNVIEDGNQQERRQSVSPTILPSLQSLLPQQQQSLYNYFNDNDKTWEDLGKHMDEEELHCKYYETPNYARGSSPIDKLLLTQEQQPPQFNNNPYTMLNDDYNNGIDAMGDNNYYTTINSNEMYCAQNEPPLLRIPRPRRAAASLLDHLPNDNEEERQYERQTSYDNAHWEMTTTDNKYERYQQNQPHAYHDDAETYYSSSAATTTDYQQSPMTETNEHHYYYNTSDREGIEQFQHQKDNMTATTTSYQSNGTSTMDNEQPLLMLPTWNYNSSNVDRLPPPDMSFFWQQRRTF